MEIKQYSIIKGKVVDSDGNPLSKVKVVITLSPTESKTDLTNKQGEYSFRFPSTDIRPLEIKLDYSLEKYTTKSVSSIYQTSETDILISYDVPRITLDLISDPTEKMISQINQDIDTQENEIVKKQLTPDVPFEAKLANTFNNKKELIKQTLIPFAVGLILEFGTTAAQNIIDKKAASIDKCPNNTKILELIQKRNKLVQQLNNLYTSITFLTKTLTISSTIISALQIGIKLIESVPYPATGVPPSLPPLTSGVIEITGTAKDKLIQALNKANIVVSILTITTATIGLLLGTIIQILNQLDGLLAQCAEDQNMDLEQINNEINALANATVSATQSEDNTYKGFTLAVKIDEKNNSKYIKRYAVAENKQGIPVLKTDSSFASDPAVLISQLKFIIDSNPNITAE